MALLNPNAPEDASGYQNISGVILPGYVSGLEPVRKSHFLVEVMGPDGRRPPEDTQYLVKNFVIPERAVEVKSARFMNHTKNYPGERVKMPPAPFTLRCMATEATGIKSASYGQGTSNAYQFFSSWFDLVYSRRSDTVGIVGEGEENVAGDIYVKCLHVDGNVFAQAWLQYAWPSAIKINDLDRDSDGDPLDFTVTFQCNDIEFEF